MDEVPAVVFDRLGLGEYEATALAHLLTLGRTTAPNLADAAGIPKARIYDVLGELSERGFIKEIPGRPKEFQAKPPAAILDRAMENRRQDFETFRTDLEAARTEFLDAFESRYQQASEAITPTEELFHVVDVGEASETETRRLYHEATERVAVVTNSYAYLDAIEPALADAVDRVAVDILFLHPDRLSAAKRERQAEIVSTLTETYPAVGIRFSRDRLPLRGTLVDPSMDYDRGEAIILVEEPNVPDHLRQAAITENGAFVAGFKRYFDLIWEYESVAEYPV